MNGRAPQDERELEDRLSEPDNATRESLARTDGDVLVLGAGGKMGPTLARMARRALDDIGAARTGAGARRVIAVSRFSDITSAHSLEEHGVEIVRANLADPSQFLLLPRARNVVWMVGQKFGTTGDPVGTWTQNVAAAAFGAQFCEGARTVCFSSGNVYAKSLVADGGSLETSALHPDGEYAASCIGRERMFESAARRLGFPLLLYRLFYACDLRYGVVTDIALRILRGEKISLATPAANVIWQGDANRLALRSLEAAAAPAIALNVTGPIVSVREIAVTLATALNRPVQFSEQPPDTHALVANTDALAESLPHDALSIQMLCEYTADWVSNNRRVLAKPTRFDVRDGKY